MTLQERILTRQAETRRAGVRAGAMMDIQLREATSREQVDGFQAHDATSDMRFRSSIKKLYASLTTPEQKELCALLYAVWEQAENADDALLDEHGNHIDGTREYIFQVTPMLVELDGCGPNGRAA